MCFCSQSLTHMSDSTEIGCLQLSCGIGRKVVSWLSGARMCQMVLDRTLVTPFDVKSAPSCILLDNLKCYPYWQWLSPNHLATRSYKKPMTNYILFSIDWGNICNPWPQHPLTPEMVLNVVMYSLITFITMPISANHETNQCCVLCSWNWSTNKLLRWFCCDVWYKNCHLMPPIIILCHTETKHCKLPANADFFSPNATAV